MDRATRELVEGLMAKAREKLAAARKFLDVGEFYDDAAAYHAAQALLKTEGLEADTHQGVVSLFGLHFAKSARVSPKLGRYLNNLKDDRESGDYDVYSGIDRETAENALREAEEFVAEAERYLQPLLNV